MQFDDLDDLTWDVLETVEKQSILARSQQPHPTPQSSFPTTNLIESNPVNNSFNFGSSSSSLNSETSTSKNSTFASPSKHQASLIHDQDILLMTQEQTSPEKTPPKRNPFFSSKSSNLPHSPPKQPLNSISSNNALQYNPTNNLAYNGHNNNVANPETTFPVNQSPIINLPSAPVPIVNTVPKSGRWNPKASSNQTLSSIAASNVSFAAQNVSNAQNLNDHQIIDIHHDSNLNQKNDTHNNAIDKNWLVQSSSSSKNQPGIVHHSTSPNTAFNRINMADIGGRCRIEVEIKYSGNQRVCVVFSAHYSSSTSSIAPSYLKYKKAPQKSKIPLIQNTPLFFNQHNLPQIFKSAMETTSEICSKDKQFQAYNNHQSPTKPIAIQNSISKVFSPSNQSNQAQSNQNQSNWPIYQESANSHSNSSFSTSHTEDTHSSSAKWIFPFSWINVLELQLKNAIEIEQSNQQQQPTFRISFSFLTLPDYVKGLIRECKRIGDRSMEIERLLRQEKAAENEKHLVEQCLEEDEKELMEQYLDDCTFLPKSLTRTDLFKTLKEYQMKGVEFAVKHDGRLLLADAPGLGKTMQALAISAYYMEEWPVLVICPSAVRMMWANEFQKWFPQLKAKDISTSFTGSKVHFNSAVNIISYELLKSPASLKKLYGSEARKTTTSNSTSNLNWQSNRSSDYHPPSGFGVIICDECHLLKSWTSERSKAILPLIKGTKRAILLSGTPATSRPSELHTNLNAILPNMFKNFFQFGERYCDAKDSAFGSGKDYSGASNLDELALILNESVLIRRLKDQVLKDLPKKRRHHILLQIPTEQKKKLTKMLRDFQNVKNDIKKTAGSKNRGQSETSPFADPTLDKFDNRTRHKNLVFELFQNAGRAKLSSAIQHVLEQLKNDPPETKYLVFAHHQDIRSGFEHALNSNGIEYIKIDGTTPATARQSLIDHYQNSPSCRVALLSIMAAGVGITLTKASKVFFAELFWNPGALLQAEDRAHRMGQKNEVDIYYLIGEGTFDQQIWEAVETKLTVLSAMLDKSAKSSNSNNQKVTNDDSPDSFDIFSVMKTSGKSSGLFEEDKFIEYLMHKIEGYEERKIEVEDRIQIRRKLKTSNPFEDDEMEEILTDNENVDDDQNQKSNNEKSKKKASPNTKRDSTNIKTDKEVVTQRKKRKSNEEIETEQIDRFDDLEPPSKKIKSYESAKSSNKLVDVFESEDIDDIFKLESKTSISQSISAPIVPLQSSRISESVSKMRDDKLSKFAFCGD